MLVLEVKRNGKINWYYASDMPCSGRQRRSRAQGCGFATKKEAATARRIEGQKKIEMAKAGSGVAAAVPISLAGLMQEFFRLHVDEKLAPNSLARYHEQVNYLDAGLLEMPLAEITSMHLNRVCDRLLKCGGHTRKTKTPRPMSMKTVRNIAGMIASAFGRAIRWGLIAQNPVTRSEPPIHRKRIGIPWSNSIRSQ